LEKPWKGSLTVLNASAVGERSDGVTTPAQSNVQNVTLMHWRKILKLSLKELNHIIEKCDMGSVVSWARIEAKKIDEEMERIRELQIRINANAHWEEGS